MMPDTVTKKSFDGPQSRPDFYRSREFFDDAVKHEQLTRILPVPEAAPEPSTSADEIKRQAAGLEVDPRLTSVEGLIQVAAHFGINTSEPWMPSNKAESFEDFQRACHQHENRLLASALISAMAGQLALDANQTPTLVRNEVEDPIGAYLTSIEFINTEIERPTSGAPEGYNERVWEFFFGRWSKAYQAAISTVDNVVEQGQATLVDRESQTHTLGIRTANSIIVHDREGNLVGSFPLFADPEDTFEMRTDLMERSVTGVNSYLRQMHGISPSKVDNVAEFFLESEYPLPEILSQGRVINLTALAPILPEQLKVLFRLDLEMTPEVWHKCEIVVGEKCMTSGGYRFDGQGSFGRPNLEVFGLPSKAEGRHEEYFEAGTAEALGAGRAAEAEAIGDEASQTTLVILKPSISPELAKFRKRVIEYKKEELTADDFVGHYDVRHASEIDTYDELERMGILDNAQAKELMAAEAKLPAPVSESTTLSDIGFSGLQFRGGGANTFGDLATRGGPLVGGDGLHISGSGIGTGTLIRSSGKQLATDPFTPPTIYAVKVFGIGEGMGPDMVEYLTKSKS